MVPMRTEEARALLGVIAGMRGPFVRLLITIIPRAFRQPLQLRLVICVHGRERILRLGFGGVVLVARRRREAVLAALVLQQVVVAGEHPVAAIDVARDVARGILAVAHAGEGADGVIGDGLGLARPCADAVLLDSARVDGAGESEVLGAHVVLEVDFRDEVFAAAVEAVPDFELAGFTEVRLAADEALALVCRAHVDVEVVLLGEELLAAGIGAGDLLALGHGGRGGVEGFDVSL